MSPRRTPAPPRRGMMTLEAVLTMATAYAIAVLAIRLGFKACALLHHAIASLVGWPIL